MITADFHLHSSFSTDSKEPMETMILHGINSGLNSMCFTEHMDWDFIMEQETDEGNFVVDLANYYQTYQMLSQKYRNKINLLFGMELGLQPHIVDKNLEISQSYPFDFIIASSHLCHRKDPYFPSFYEGRSEKEAYLEYFESILENIELYQNFNVYGHLDYVVRYGPNQNKNYRYQEYSDILDAILMKLIFLGKGIECNTGGLAPRYHLGDTHPCFTILKRYHELGGEIITIGSDSHTASNIAYGFDYARASLEKAGFHYYSVFRKQKPVMLPL